MIMEERLLIVRELKEALVRETAKGNLTQKIVDENETDWESPYTVKKKSMMLFKSSN